MERACFIALNANIYDTFKVTNIPTIVSWHVSMETRIILDQLSQTYGQPTPAALELNDVTFCGPHTATNAPKVLFRHIKIALRLQFWETTRIQITSEEQNFDLAKLISIRVWYMHADQINFIS